MVADGRYDYLETGSLISLRMNVGDIVIPSEEEHVEMFPMDFEEFLWAMGDETTIPFLRDCFERCLPLGQAMHKRIMNDFRQYMLVGGMPQAVEAYMKTKSFENAFMWLAEAMIVNNCYNATDPNVGLSMSEEHSARKCYIGDTGLLVSHSFMDDNFIDNELYRDILLDRLHVNEGMLTENIVAQELRANGHRLYFYSRSDTNQRKNNMEIDFLIRKKRKICPIEVKSGVYRKHSSLDKFRNRFSNKIGQSYILYTKDILVKEEVIHLPLYMAMFL